MMTSTPTTMMTTTLSLEEDDKIEDACNSDGTNSPPHHANETNQDKEIVPEVNFEMIFHSSDHPIEIFAYATSTKHQQQQSGCNNTNNQVEWTLPHDPSYESRIKHTDVPLGDDDNDNNGNILNGHESRPTSGAHQHNRCYMIMGVLLSIVFVAVYVTPKTMSQSTASTEQQQQQSLPLPTTTTKVTPESNNLTICDDIDQRINGSMTPSMSPTTIGD